MRQIVKRMMVFAVCMVTVLGFISPALSATYTVTQATTNDYHDINPRICTNGDMVWWYNDDIFIKDGSTGLIKQLPDPNGVSDSNIEVNDNGDIVWLRVNLAELDTNVMLYTKATNTIIRISLPANPLFQHNDNNPQLNNLGQVVYESYDGNDQEIMLYSGGAVTQVTDNLVNDNNPRINNNGDIVWRASSKGSSSGDIWLRTGGTNTWITATANDDTGHRINNAGDIVWSGSDGAHYQIWYFQKSTGQKTQLTNTSVDNINPRINANGYITWTAGTENTDWETWRRTGLNGISSNISLQPSHDDINPRINDNGWVTWQEDQGVAATNDQIFVWDGTTTTRIKIDAYDHINPTINNYNTVVWQGTGGTGATLTDYEIWVGLTGLCADAATRCNDNNACTYDACNFDTGACINTPVVCNDNNACTNDTCNTATGCVYTPVVCNDNNICTNDTCNPATGCVYTPVVCNDGNLCTTDTCVPGTGCVFTPKCNDNNPCTTDSCNTATGACTNTTIVCNDNNLCTTDACNTATGQCVYTLNPAVCPTTTNNNFTMLDTNNNVVGGTNDISFSWDGVKKTSVAVSSQISNALLTSSCIYSSSFWKAHDLAVYSAGTYTVYTACPAGSPGCGLTSDPTGVNCPVGNICPPVTFTVNPGEIGIHMLFDWGGNTNIDVVNVLKPNAKFAPSPMAAEGPYFCGTNSSCTVWGWMSYDPATDNDNINGIPMVDGPFPGFSPNFSYNKVTPVDLCCDAATRCNDSNECTIDTCNTSTGACINTPRVCTDNNLCTNDTCNTATGCVFTPKCDDGDACTDNTCNTATGVCSYPPRNCNDNNLCTTDVCNSLFGCINMQNTCDDNNACTTDSCNTANGACVNTPKVCVSGVCDPVTGCPSVSTHGGNLTLIMSNGFTVGGTNDVKLTINGSLQDAARFANGTGQSNATLTSDEPFAGLPWTARQVQVVSAGTYSVDLDGGGTGTNLFEVTIPAGQIGAHLLLDWGSNTNVDVWLAWDSNKAFATGKLFTGSDNGTTGTGVIDGSPNASTAVWGLASVDLAGRIKDSAGNTITNLPLDGNPGISIQDPGGLFSYSANFNVMVTDLCADAATRCNDNNPCTVDLCAVTTGVCSHPAKNCSDNNKCTTDTCNTATGACVNTPVPIDDNNACTTDSCNPTTGVITHTPKVCNDNNLCTTDTCNTATGNCVFTNNALACDDNNICTENDACSGGVCTGTAKVCYSGGVCNTATGCPPVNTHGGNFSLMLSYGSAYFPIGGTNDVKFWWDGTLQDALTFDNGNGPINAYITSDEPFGRWLWYAKSVQVVGPGTYWVYLDGGAGDPTRFEVTIPAGKIGAHLLLDWGSTDPALRGYCGKMSCDADVWLAWDLNKAYAAGKLYTGVDSGNASTANLDGLPYVTDGSPNALTSIWGVTSIDLAGRLTDGAGNTITNLPLDGVPGIVMKDGALAGYNVDFSLMLKDLCGDAATRCNDNNICTTDLCNVTTGLCVNQMKNCNDNNKCTADTCNTANGACLNTPVVIDDNNACTTDSCNIYTGVITHTPKVCNDNNLCTTDTCNTANGACVFTNNTLACDDNNICTENDACSGGTCAGTAKVCYSGGTCNTATGCPPVSTSGNNLTLMQYGSPAGGTNDVKFWWDGTLQDAAAFDNGYGLSNATISSDEPFGGWLWYAKQVQVVGPGTYWVYLDGGAGDPTRFEVTIPPGKIGAHLLLDWGSTDPAVRGYCGKMSCDADVWLAWDFNKAYAAGQLWTGADNGITYNANLDGLPYVKDGRANTTTMVWGMASVDLAGRLTDAAGNTLLDLPLDGTPGISMNDGTLAGYSANFNVMLQGL